MYKVKLFLVISLFSFILAACTVLPEGPSVQTFPGSKKTITSYEDDDYRCQYYAKQQSGGQTPNEVKEQVTGDNAFIGALFGAALGAIFGNSSSVAAGAVTGALFGGLSGNDKGEAVAAGVQYDYDQIYTSCMYSAGHKVPAKNVIFVEQATKVVVPSVVPVSIVPVAPVDVPRSPYGVPPDFRK